MEVVIKKIINCETNLKFVRQREDGCLDIPDYILYAVSEEGELYQLPGWRWCKVWQLGEKIEIDDKEDWTTSLVYEDLDRYYSFWMQKGYAEEDAIDEVKYFVEKARKQLPYLYMYEGVQEWMETEQ